MEWENLNIFTGDNFKGTPEILSQPKVDLYF